MGAVCWNIHQHNTHNGMQVWLVRDSLVWFLIYNYLRLSPYTGIIMMGIHNLCVCFVISLKLRSYPNGSCLQQRIWLLTTLKFWLTKISHYRQIQINSQTSVQSCIEVALIVFPELCATLFGRMETDRRSANLYSPHFHGRGLINGGRVIKLGTLVLIKLSILTKLLT